MIDDYEASGYAEAFAEQYEDEIAAEFEDAQAAQDYSGDDDAGGYDEGEVLG